MTGQHTPGPWETYTDPLNGNVRILAGPKVVANLARGLGLWAPDTDANARLIAAAPELLAALQRIVQLAGDDEHEPVMAWKDAFAAGAAAIAKAEGGE